jgi:hypothetical protein
MPPKGRRRQVFGGEEIRGDTAPDSTQDTPSHPSGSIEEIDYTPTRSDGALKRTPPTTAIRGGRAAEALSVLTLSLCLLEDSI